MLGGIFSLMWEILHAWRESGRNSAQPGDSLSMRESWKPCQRSHIKVKGHLRSSCKIGWKCESDLIWKVEVRLEPNLVYWYNMGPIVCSCSQRSQMKVKSPVRPMCKISWKCNMTHLHTWGPIRTMWPQQVWDQGQVSICIIHKPRRHSR